MNDTTLNKLAGYTDLREFLRDHPDSSRDDALRGLQELAKRLLQESTERVGSMLVFQDTNTSVARLFTAAADGRSIADFYWEYPSIRKADVLRVLTAALHNTTVLVNRGDPRLTSVETKQPDATVLLKNTETPVYALFDTLLRGETAKDFVLRFHGAAKNNVQAVLREAGQALTDPNTPQEGLRE